jgi:hypothetical protein
MLDWVLWVLVAASALHVVEEHALGLSVVLGAAGMASVIVVLMLKGRFRYADV